MNPVTPLMASRCYHVTLRTIPSAVVPVCLSPLSIESTTISL